MFFNFFVVIFRWDKISHSCSCALNNGANHELLVANCMQASLHICMFICVCFACIQLPAMRDFYALFRVFAFLLDFCCTLLSCDCFIAVNLLLLLSWTALYRRNWPTTKLYHKPVRLWLGTRNSDDSVGHMLAACCTFVVVVGVASLRWLRDFNARLSSLLTAVWQMCLTEQYWLQIGGNWRSWSPTS